MVSSRTGKNETGAAGGAAWSAARGLLLAGTASVLFWSLVRAVGQGGLARLLAVGLFLLLSGVALRMGLRRRYVEMLMALAYLSAVEPAIRGYGRGLPYLSLEYLVLLCAATALLQRRAPLSLPGLFLGGYLLVEFIGAGVSADPDHGRWMVVMTAARFGLLMIAERTDLTGAATLRIVAAFVAGTLAMAAMALQGSLGEEIEWSTQSNATAAGGFGPNQVSAILGFGVFGTLFLADVTRSWLPRSLYLGLAGAQLLAALLTLSRGGVVVLAIGLILYVLLLLLRLQTSLAVAGGVAVLVLVALFAVARTDQVLLSRYQDTHMSHREDIWALGIRIFWEHPLLGVGTGNFYEASEGRLAAYHGRVGTHNEFIRALSEHGIVGAVLFTGFLLAVLARAWRETRGLPRACALAWLLMAVACESNIGLKLTMSMLFTVLPAEAFRPRRLPSRRRSAWPSAPLPQRELSGPALRPPLRPPVARRDPHVADPC